MLEVNNLNYAFGTNKILKNVSFTTSQQEIISLLGPNGSGKSTLLRCLCGLLKTNDQDIKVFNSPINSFSKKELAKKISFLPQFQQKIQSINVKSLVAMGRTPYIKSGWLLTKEDTEIIDWAIETMKLNEFQHKMLNNLSGGERQRVFIAMILAQNTPIVLLDEPVTYMDLKYQWDLLEIIYELKTIHKKTIISVFHDIHHALEISDKVCLLLKGEVYKMGATSEVITKENINHVYDINARVCSVASCKRSVVIPQGKKLNFS